MSVIKIIYILIQFLFLSNFCNANQLDVNLSSGYEKITTPLVRIDVDSPLILVEGRAKLAGHYHQLNVNGGIDWDFNNENSAELNGNLSIKQAPKAEGLNFSSASLDTVWRHKIDDISIGIGPSVQRIWIANEAFRDNISLQADVTHTKADGSYANFYLAASKNYFVDEFKFFNNHAISGSFSQHLKDIGLGFSALDWELSASRDKNVMDADDLSNYSYYGRVSIDRKMLGLTWSVGASITKSNFDSPFADGFDKRRDRYVSYEFGIEREFTDNLTMSLDFTKAKNSSNLALFESDYKAASLTLKYSF